MRVYCPACNEYTEFEFRGRQEGLRNVLGFDLYNCLKCDHTIENDILELKIKNKSRVREN